MDNFVKENLVPFSTVIIFFTVGFYFIILFLRTRKRPEILFFGAAAILFALYFFLRTQFKFYLSSEYLLFKRLEYITFFSAVFILCNFIYFFFSEFESRFEKLEKRLLYINNIALFSVIPVPILSGDITFWNWFNKTIVQPLWILP
ncbi:MAG: hypothetical protein GY754_12700 [bacterium]|nr:hypothetical protein [bacterium]